MYSRNRTNCSTHRTVILGMFEPTNLGPQRAAVVMSELESGVVGRMSVDVAIRVEDVVDLDDGVQSRSKKVRYRRCCDVRDKFS